MDNPEAYVQGIFRAAREGGAEALDRARVADLEPQEGQHEAFVGTGYRFVYILDFAIVAIQRPVLNSEAKASSFTFLLKMRTLLFYVLSKLM